MIQQYGFGDRSCRRNGRRRWRGGSRSSAAARLSSLVVVTLAVLLVFSVAGLSQADPALLDRLAGGLDAL